MGVYEPRHGWQAPDVDRRQGADPTVAELLAFEAEFPTHTGAKEEALRSRFKLRSPRYYQLLHKAIQTPEALELNALIVHRVQDRIAARLRRRTNRSNTRRQNP